MGVVTVCFFFAVVIVIKTKDSIANIKIIASRFNINFEKLSPVLNKFWNNGYIVKIKKSKKASIIIAGISCPIFSSLCFT